MRQVLEDGTLRIDESLLNERSWQVGGLSFDNEYGIGSVPNMADIFWKGVLVGMTPRTFLSLTPELVLSERPGTVPYFDGNPGAFGTPYLTVKTTLEGDDPVVRGHEGRHRMYWIAREYGLDFEVPVGLFAMEEHYQLKAREIEQELVEKIAMGALREKTRDFVEGPLFSRAIWSHGVFSADLILQAKPAPSGQTMG